LIGDVLSFGYQVAWTRTSQRMSKCRQLFNCFNYSLVQLGIQVLRKAARARVSVAKMAAESRAARIDFYICT